MWPVEIQQTKRKEYDMCLGPIHFVIKFKIVVVFMK